MDAPRDYEVLWVLLHAAARLVEQAPIVAAVGAGVLFVKLWKPGRW